MSVKAPILQSFGLTNNFIQIHQGFIIWESLTMLLNLKVTTSLLRSNNLVSVNLNAFKLYDIKYVVIILACSLASYTMFRNIFSINLFLLFHFMSLFLSDISCSLLSIQILNYTISSIGDNIGISTSVYWNGIIYITYWSSLKYNQLILSILVFAIFLGVQNLLPPALLLVWQASFYIVFNLPYLFFRRGVLCF